MARRKEGQNQITEGKLMTTIHKTKWSENEDMKDSLANYLEKISPKRVEVIDKGLLEYTKSHGSKLNNKTAEEMDRLLTKYENLVWYARKPGNLKLTKTLTKDLEYIMPSDPDALVDKYGQEMSREDCFVLDEDLDIGQWVRFPFNSWARKGEQISGLSWDDGKYHKDILKGMLEQLLEVEAKYPVECEDLNGEETGGRSYTHGFNSGCLATLRYILDLETDPTTEPSDFGQLDT